LQAIKQKIGSSLSLSVAIGCGSWRTGAAYDIPNIFATCDFVNLMAYDLHGTWQDSVTANHGALFRSSLDNTALNVHESVQLLTNMGVQKDKLIVGIPSYGRGFILRNANNNGVNASADRYDNNGIPFNQICPRTKSGSLNYRWDDTQKVPYAFAGTEWIGYDDVRSVIEKCNYIKNSGLGGAMIWKIDSDDFSGTCENKRFPLISAIYSNLVGSVSV
jgi:chitinase